jgi:hypothetical protein
MPPSRQPTPIWELLLLLGLLLVPVDVFFRRVYLDPSELWAGFLRGAKNAWLVATFRRPKTTAQRDESMGSLMAAKQRAHADRDKEEEERQARLAFRDRLQQQDAPAGESVFEDPNAAGQKGPARHRTKQTVTPTDGPERGAPAPGGSSLSDLKKAKERAKKKM